MTLTGNNGFASGLMGSKLFSVVCRFERPTRCREIICGLGLIEGLDEAAFASLKNSVKQAIAKGISVKISYGGIRFGNLQVHKKVSNIWLTKNGLISRFFFILDDRDG